MTINHFFAVAGVLALAACDSATSKSADLGGKSFMTESNGTPVTISFNDTEMRVNGRVVNLYNGTYEVSGNQIKFGPIASTMMMGPEDAMAAERDYFVFLDTVDTYDLSGETLVLHGADGRDIVFKQVELNEDAEPVPAPQPLPAHARPVISLDEVKG